MSTILTAVIPEPDAEVAIREVPEPELAPDSALMTVTLSEVCGTDVYLQQGRLEGVPYPLIPGHVSVGVLSKIRGTMLDIEGQPLAEGDAVTFLDVHRTCHACWHCLVAKASTRCPKRKVYGITYGFDDVLAGGWAQAVYLRPGTRCIRLNGADPRRFMAGGCALPTALHAIERAEVAIGQTVLVLGSGPVGLSAVICAHIQGAHRVLCIGAPADRLKNAEAAAASATLDISDHDPAAREAWVLEQTAGRGADVTIEATGRPEAVQQAFRMTRDAGRVVIVGQYTDHGEVSFNPHTELNRKHLDVRGCWGSDFSHFYRGVQLMGSPRSDHWGHLDLETFGLADAQAGLDAVRTARVVKALIAP